MQGFGSHWLVVIYEVDWKIAAPMGHGKK